MRRMPHRDGVHLARGNQPAKDFAHLAAGSERSQEKLNLFHAGGDDGARRPLRLPILNERSRMCPTLRACS